MAGFAAHEIFGEEALRGISDAEMLSVINKHRGIFGIGCQGPDLFLYNLAMFACDEERNLGKRMHIEGTARFFAYLWQTVWEAESSAELEVGLSYLYGALAHYTLDTMTHPYIYARIGYDPKVPYSQKATRGLHHRLEAAIDAKLLSVKKSILPSLYRPDELMEADRQERENLAKVLVKAVRRTYKVGLKKENVFGALKMMQMVAVYYYGASEKKRINLEKCERYITESYLFSNLMVTDDYICKRKVMNHENMLWRNPWDTERESTESVWQLYQKALERYREYQEEFWLLENRVLHRRQQLIIKEAVEKWEKKRKRGRKKDMASDIMEQPDWESDEKGFSEEVRRAVKKLGNRSYYSGLRCE